MRGSRLSTLALAFAALLALTFGALACGDDDADDEPGFEENPLSEPAQGGSPGEIIAVELNEYSIVVNQTVAPSGEVTFALRNTGDQAHQFWVIRTDIPAAGLPLEGDVGRVDVTAKDLDVVLMQEAFPPDEEPVLAAVLEPGHYALICNLTGHYARGMQLDFVVAREP